MGIDRMDRTWSMKMTQIEMLAKALGVTPEQLQALADNAKEKAKEEKR